MIQQLLHDAIESNDCSTISPIQSEIVPIDASGDNNSPIAASQDVPLAMKGVDFVGSLDAALADGRIDVAVHSLKDIPPANRWQNDLMIGSYSDREDPLDVLVSDRYFATLLFHLFPKMLELDLLVLGGRLSCYHIAQM